MLPRIRWRIWIPWMMLFVVTNGCDNSTQIAREAADRQAEQNRQMAQLNKEVAAGTHRLVEADAKTRQELIGVHRLSLISAFLYYRYRPPVSTVRHSSS